MICSYSKPVIRLIDMNYNIGKKLLSEILPDMGRRRDELDSPHDTEDAGFR